MSVTFYTSTPRKLLKKFDEAIEKPYGERRITTWENDGEYYTHTAIRWHEKAWFSARIVAQKELIFNIIRPKNSKITTSVYAYYHGHLIETFLNHFDELFHDAAASSLPTSNDKV